MNRTAAACVALTILSGSPLPAQPATRACHSGLPGHIRVMDCRLAVGLADGLRRSVTLQQLVGRIASLNGIIYVAFEPTPAVRKNLLGSLSHQVTVAGTTTILRVTVLRNQGDTAIATLGHEFRHAIELLEDGPRTEADVRAFFERNGTRIAPGVFETDEAVAAGRSVLRELQAAKPAAPR
jgi:hypothetical protein